MTVVKGHRHGRRRIETRNHPKFHGALLIFRQRAAVFEKPPEVVDRYKFAVLSRSYHKQRCGIGMGNEEGQGLRPSANRDIKSSPRRKSVGKMRAVTRC